MRFANDSHGQRVCADDAVKGEEHFCPTCSNPLVLKKGKVILPHFAHFPNQPCTDTWSYDESPWQQNWQRKFRADQQEVIVSHSAQSHRADIIAGSSVILFLDSAITSKFFHEKTKFFQYDGKDVFWVIHVEEDLDAGILRASHRDKNQMFWDHPPAFLKKVNLKENKKLHILLDLGNGNLKKVEWVAPDSGFERFIIDASYTPDITTEEGRKDAILNQYGRFDALKMRNLPWKKKISSTNGATNKQWHICERTGKYHCDECKHCTHNLITQYQTTNPKTGAAGGLFFYCRYPEIAHPTNVGKDGKPRADVPTIWLK